MRRNSRFRNVATCSANLCVTHGCPSVRLQSRSSASGSHVRAARGYGNLVVPVETLGVDAGWPFVDLSATLFCGALADNCDKPKR